jgi:hypothetical protein
MKVKNPTINRLNSGAQDGFSFPVLLIATIKLFMDNENVKDHERLFSNRMIATWTI